MATTTTTAQQLNPFIQDILARNYGAAQQVAATPYQAYQGPRIAGFRPAEEQAFGVATRAATEQVGMPQLQQATQVAQRAAGYTPQQFQQDVSGFMSPFQTNVIDATMARLAQNRAERDAATKAQLASSRAFGNERRGVYEAQLAGEEDLNTAQTLANLYNQGYLRVHKPCLASGNRRWAISRHTRQCFRALVKRSAAWLSRTLIWLTRTSSNSAASRSNSFRLCSWVRRVFLPQSRKRQLHRASQRSAKLGRLRPRLVLSLIYLQRLSRCR